jgi:hypothetical protein
VRRPFSSLIAPPLPALLVALVVALNLAVLPGAAQDTTSAAGYSVRGTVVNGISGQPIARALVALNQEQAMLTNSEGAFSFDNVAAGEYSVSVQKPGYMGFGGMMAGMRIPMGARQFRHPPPRRIQVGPDMPTLSFSIAPLAMITGHLTLSTADPADGISVQAFLRRFQNGRAQWVVAGQARTRSDGSFRMADLAPGSYMVSTMPSLDRPGAAANDRGPVWGYPSLYYPGVTEVAAAGVLTLGAGQQAEADITVVRQQFFPITAVVHSSSESPASFQILDSGGRNTGIFANWDRREGVARASVPNGTWTMEAHAYGKAMEFGSTTFQVNGTPVSFAISVLPIPHIPVIIRREFQASADNPEPTYSGPGINLNLIRADDMGTGNFSGGGMMHTDGSSGSEWELNVNEPGRYWVQAQAFAPGYVSSITSGGVDLGSNPLVIIPGSTPAPVEVTLRNDGGTITGQIAMQTPVSSGSTPSQPGEQLQLWIYAIPLFATAGQAPNVMPSPTGQFSFYNLAPGSYRVVACDAQQDIDFHSPEGLAIWAGKGQTVSVDPGGTASVDLDVVHMTAATE